MRKGRRVLLMLRSPENLRMDYLILALLFLLGIVIGHILGGMVKYSQQKELFDYISAYTREISSHDSVPLAGIVFSYFRSAAALFLMGLASCGLWLVPLFMAGQGFILGFSVHCFGVALGRNGIWIALASFGLRCVFVLPCCFYLAARSWSNAAKLRRIGQIREKPDSGRSSFYPIIICGIVLLIGCMLEISLVPRLLTSALRHIS